MSARISYASALLCGIDPWPHSRRRSSKPTAPLKLPNYRIGLHHTEWENCWRNRRSAPPPASGERQAAQVAARRRHPLPQASALNAKCFDGLQIWATSDLQIVLPLGVPRRARLTARPGRPRQDAYQFHSQVVRQFAGCVSY
jgi:hypothetical protein